jgi:hypothetical protein
VNYHEKIYDDSYGYYVVYYNDVLVCVCDDVCDDVSVQVYGDDDDDDDDDVNCDKQDNKQCLLIHTHIYQDKSLCNCPTQHILR